MIDLDRIENTSVKQLRRVGSMKCSTFPDALPAWPAEMDFGCAPPVTRALREATTGRGHEGFVRFNFATPRSILDRLIDQIAGAL